MAKEQTGTLKNLFHYFGLNRQADQLLKSMEAAVNGAALKLFLLEAGSAPETVPLGAAACPRVLNALVDGDPVIVTDGEGHSALIFHRDDKFFISLEVSPETNELSCEAVRSRLRDPKSEAIVIHSMPDPAVLCEF